MVHWPPALTFGVSVQVCKDSVARFASMSSKSNAMFLRIREAIVHHGLKKQIASFLLFMFLPSVWFTYPKGCTAMNATVVSIMFNNFLECKSIVCLFQRSCEVSSPLVSRIPKLQGCEQESIKHHRSFCPEAAHSQMTWLWELGPKLSLPQLCSNRLRLFWGLNPRALAGGALEPAERRAWRLAKAKSPACERFRRPLF